MNLHIDMISDVICPWCWIGKRRLERAIAVVDRQVSVRLLPFSVRLLPLQLNPTMQSEGVSRKEYRVRKFGSWERSLELDARVQAIGVAEGIHFAFDRIERTPNTLDAHRLIALADTNGVQDAVAETLFRAYFTEGRDISNRRVLIDVVVEAGLDRQQAENLLQSDEGLEAIRSAEQNHRRLGVQGVPFFILNDRIALEGAQEPAVFVNAFRMLLAEGDRL